MVHGRTAEPGKWPAGLHIVGVNFTLMFVKGEAGWPDRDGADNRRHV